MNWNEHGMLEPAPSVDALLSSRVPAQAGPSHGGADSNMAGMSTITTAELVRLRRAEDKLVDMAVMLARTRAALKTAEARVEVLEAAVLVAHREAVGGLRDLEGLNL